MKNEIEEFIKDWHYDDKSYTISLKLGTFLLEFIEYLKDKRIGNKKIQEYRNYCQIIGKIELDHGYRNDFKEEMFLNGEIKNELEFKKKMGDSENKLKLYKKTIEEIKKYINDKKKLTFQVNGEYLHKIEINILNTPNSKLLFPKHRVELIKETEQKLVLLIPAPLIIQMFLEKLLNSKSEIIKIKISNKEESNYKLDKIEFLNDNGVAHVFFNK